MRMVRLGIKSYARVLLVDHSLGSGIFWIDAGIYHDVDGGIITGLVHHLNTPQLTAILASFYPADLDPRFADAGYGAGYLTTEPGTRAGHSYYQPDADPNINSTNEPTK